MIGSSAEGTTSRATRALRHSPIASTMPCGTRSLPVLPPLRRTSTNARVPDADPTDRPLPTPTAAAYPPDDLPRMTGTATWAFVSTFEELVDSSDLFVVGDVIDIAPARTAARRGEASEARTARR